MWLWLACAGADEAEDLGVCGDPTQAENFVFTEMLFVRSDAGVSDGFDLDGHVSDGGLPEDCDVADLEAPDGTPGIDNAWANLLPALELTEAAAIEGLIQDAINSGEVLLVAELSALDEAPDDDCVDLRIFRADGQPLVGTDDRLLPGQTFDPDPTREPVFVPGVAYADGVLRAEGFDLLLPLSVFGKSFEFTLEDATIEMHVLPDGRAEGIVAGGLSVTYALEVAATEDVDPDLVGVMASLLGANADLGYDPATGTCSHVSLAFAWKAVPSYWYED